MNIPTPNSGFVPAVGCGDGMCGSAELPRHRADHGSEFFIFKTLDSTPGHIQPYGPTVLAERNLYSPAWLLIDHGWSVAWSASYISQ
eukprot:COSAG01_NODE_16924_length_1193_cov_1.433272_1_plen_87_part_00